MTTGDREALTQAVVKLQDLRRRICDAWPVRQRDVLRALDDALDLLEPVEQRAREGEPYTPAEHDTGRHRRAR